MSNETTNFEEDLKREDAKIHLDRIRNKCLEKDEWLNVKLAEVMSCHLSNLDGILQYDFLNNPITRLIECKTDSHCKKNDGENFELTTKNLAIELVATINPSHIQRNIEIYNKIEYQRSIHPFFQKDIHEYLCQIVDDVAKNKIKAKTGLGMGKPMEDENILSYMFYCREEQRVVKHFLYVSEKIRKKVSETYENNSLTITSTNNKWNTICCLIPIANVKSDLLAEIV